MRDAAGVLPGVEDVVDDLGDTDAVADLGEEEGTDAPHALRVAGHDVEVGSHGRGQVGLVDDKEVALGEAGSALAGDLVAPGDVDDLDGVIGEFAAVAGGEVVATGFDEEEVGVELALEFLEGEEVGGDVVADGGVGATTGLDGADAFGGKGAMADEELAVLAGEDVVGDGGEVHAFAESAAEFEHEGGLAGTDGAADADGEGPLGVVAVDGGFAVIEVPGAVVGFVGVPVGTVGMGVRMRVRMSVRRIGAGAVVVSVVVVV